MPRNVTVAVQIRRFWTINLRVERTHRSTRIPDG
jgi:hypothetical protein